MQYEIMRRVVVNGLAFRQQQFLASTINPHLPRKSLILQKQRYRSKPYEQVKHYCMKLKFKEYLYMYILSPRVAEMINNKLSTVLLG